MNKDQRVRQHVEARVMDAFAPAHILVDAKCEIVYCSARTGKYLEPQMGSPSRQLLSMARRGLRLELGSALREAVEKRHAVVREHIEVELDDRVQIIRLTIEPMIESDQEPLYLVVFTDLGPPLSREEAAQYKSSNVSHDIAHLEQELKETRDLDEFHRANADMRNLFESTQIAAVFLDRFMSIRSYTPAVTAIFNLIPSDRGRPITDIAHQLDGVELQRDIRQVMDERKALERPVRMRDGNVFHLMRILPYRTANDEMDGALITFVDVTAVVVAEEQQRLLVAELNHRVRNMLQVVMGLASQTLHRSTDLSHFEKTFFGRMQALARAYELLSRDGWRKVPIAELLHIQLGPFATEGARYSGEGESIVLTANAALSLGLVLYELATNSTKYGALSVSGGHVFVRWHCRSRTDGGKEFILEWKETGGPAVKPPTRHGFGSELVQRQLKYELNGTASMDFHETGLVATLAIPLEEAIEAHASPEDK